MVEFHLTTRLRFLVGRLPVPFSLLSGPYLRLNASATPNLVAPTECGPELALWWSHSHLVSWRRRPPDSGFLILFDSSWTNLEYILQRAGTVTPFLGRVASLIHLPWKHPPFLGRAPSWEALYLLTHLGCRKGTFLGCEKAFLPRKRPRPSYASSPIWEGSAMKHFSLNFRL